MKLKIIAAVASNNVIGGEHNKIPWDFHPQDMTIFSEKTKSEGATVAMGRKTFLSLPERFRPLPGRRNIVLTRSDEWKYESVEIFKNKETLISALNNKGPETVWVCGGAEIYDQFIDLAEELHISHFNVTPDNGVAFFPAIDYHIWEEVESKHYLDHLTSPGFSHKVYKKRNSIHVS